MACGRFRRLCLDRGTWSLGDECDLEDLYVAPGARGVGTGRALIEAVYRAADHRGADRVYWLTHETGSTARALCERVGGAAAGATDTRQAVRRLPAAGHLAQTGATAYPVPGPRWSPRGG